MASNHFWYDRYLFRTFGLVHFQNSYESDFGITPFVLELSTKNAWRSWIIWLLVYLIGMIVELIGVNTSLLFGTYRYGENLGVKVFGVPILIGINWVVLTFLTATISKSFIKNKWLAILFGSILMVLLDFFIEPTAPIFDFWSWESGSAPFRNFVDWFVVSLLLQIIVKNDLPEESASFPIQHLASQFVFFYFSMSTLHYNIAIIGAGAAVFI